MTEPKKGWLQRLTSGLSRSSKQMTEQVVSTFTKQPLDQAKLDELIHATEGARNEIAAVENHPIEEIEARRR